MVDFQCKIIKFEGLKLVMGASTASYGRISDLENACNVRG